MHMKNHIVWLSYTVAVEQKDFFRNKVLQFLSGKNKGLIVSPPQQQKKSEETHQSELNQIHQCLTIPDTPVPIKHFGLSVAEDSTHSLLTVCRHENYTLNNVCYEKTDHLQQVSSFTPTFQDWTKTTVDLVFLFDGSGSMTEAEFNKNKEFIVDIMDSLKNSSVKFAAVQFSTGYRKVFDFNDVEAGTALDKLKNEPHMKALTNTHRALAFVLEQVFENPDAGASPDATKVLVLITDGDPTDLDRYKTVQRYDEKNIIRFVIGVKNARLDKFTAIASQPTEKHTIKLENYDGLTGILENQMEGSSVAQSGVFFKVCCPNVVHTYHENSYLNSVCYRRTDHLQQVSSLVAACQDWTKTTVDFVFLFDGSGSMTEAEFNKNKEFIVDIMNSLKSSSVKFAAVQFSTGYRKVFDFNDVEAGTALDKLKNEPHMKALTNTHRALTFVLEQVFENPDAGASPDATKVLVLITDGDPTDLDRYKTVQRYDEKNIIRFVIGVKNAKLDKFTAIASQPTEKYAFKIENYDGLTGILGDFQKKIFNMEGSKVTRAGEETNEMSQSRFSAVFYNDALMIGSLRSNSWRGSLREIQELKATRIEDPDMQMDSYMGQSMCVGEKNNSLLYFTGAPRFERTGQVVVFRHNCTDWSPVQRLNGAQIGSYFGAELCSVDIDSDGNTDFLLVGAPLFYQPQEKAEGQIYIYTLTDEMQLESELNVTGPSMGRFGTTIASLADLNGDGLRDVAVGAPLEDDNRGAVYIYLGDRRRGIRSTFSQRVTGQQTEPGLRFFGQAIDGDVDLGEDGLPDIVIGSQGTAVVLRSRPVFDVLTHLTFQPEDISTEEIDCLVNTDEIIPMGNLTACFEMAETTKSKAGIISSRLNISYTLDVDPMRQTCRGFFSPTDRKGKSLTSTNELRDKDTCFNYSIYMLKCVEDTSSPVSIRLNFYQVDSESANAVLNVDSKQQAVVEIPFRNYC